MTIWRHPQIGKRDSPLPEGRRGDPIKTGLGHGLPIPGRDKLIATLIAMLGTFYQNGNFAQVETIARSMLAAIPNDLVALQFLGLALYHMGRIDDARQVFQRVEKSGEAGLPEHNLTSSEPAAVTSYREATRSGSGLADPWRQISAVLEHLGFHKPALRAFRASLKATIPQPASTIELRAPLRRL